MSEKTKEQTVIKTDAKEKMNTDEKVLRYLITGAENFVRSTAGGWCYYIFVKPGMFDRMLRVSNIDIVQAVYTEHGINVKKHVSHLDGKEQEVLFMLSEEVIKLDEAKLTFLQHSAPAHIYGDDVRRRETELVNKIYHSQKKPVFIGNYAIEEKTH